MANIAARYWGIRGGSGGIRAIGEIEIMLANGAENFGIIQATGDIIITSNISSTALFVTPSNAAMDGDESTQQTVPQAGAIGMDVGSGSEVRMIVLKNCSNLMPENFIPFAIDSLAHYVGVGGGPSKIMKYSSLKTIEPDGTVNFYYTILPTCPSNNVGIASDSIVDQKGKC